jgi:hypothetical protein
MQEHYCGLVPMSLCCGTDQPFAHHITIDHQVLQNVIFMLIFPFQCLYHKDLFNLKFYTIIYDDINYLFYIFVRFFGASFVGLAKKSQKIGLAAFTTKASLYILQSWMDLWIFLEAFLLPLPQVHFIRFEKKHEHVRWWRCVMPPRPTPQKRNTAR